MSDRQPHPIHYDFQTAHAPPSIEPGHERDLVPWGWAPGSYMGHCYHCGAVHMDADKRASLCYVCASEARDAYEARSPNAPRLSAAPPAPFASWQEAANHWKSIAEDRLEAANRNLMRARKGESERDEASQRLVEVLRLVRRLVNDNKNVPNEQKPTDKADGPRNNQQWISTELLADFRFWYSGRRS